MSLKSFLDFTDDKLAKDHSTPAFDAQRARAGLVKVIDRAATSFSEGKTTGKRSWSVNRNVVEFTLPVALDGKTTFYIPAERFPDALSKLKAAVEKGEADSALEAANGDDDQPKAARRQSKPREAGDRPGWSEDRRARFQASIAARKAAKAD